MQDIHFIVQNQREAFADIISASVLSNFTTNLTRQHNTALDRVDVPSLDPETSITFYLSCRMADRARVRKLLDENLMKKRIYE